MKGHVRRAALTLLMLGGTTVAALQGRAGDAASGHSHACVFDTQAMQTAPGACRPRAISYPPKITTKVERAIYDGALTFGIPYKILLQIAECESGLNPKAKHKGHFGLYQFLPATFHRGAEQLKHDTGIQAHTYWRPLDSSYVAGFLFATGGAGSWTCEGKVFSLPPSAR